MPVYEYECLCCKAIVELQRPIVERDSPVVCMTCNIECLAVISAPVVIISLENKAENNI